MISRRIGIADLPDDQKCRGSDRVAAELPIELLLGLDDGREELVEVSLDARSLHQSGELLGRHCRVSLEQYIGQRCQRLLFRKVQLGQSLSSLPRLVELLGGSGDFFLAGGKGGWIAHGSVTLGHLHERLSHLPQRLLVLMHQFHAARGDVGDVQLRVAPGSDR